MIVVEDLKSATIGEKVSKNIETDSVVKTNNYISYSKLKDLVWCHIPQKSNQKLLEKHFHGFI